MKIKKKMFVKTFKVDTVIPLAGTGTVEFGDGLVIAWYARRETRRAQWTTRFYLPGHFGIDMVPRNRDDIQRFLTASRQMRLEGGFYEQADTKYEIEQREEAERLAALKEKV